MKEKIISIIYIQDILPRICDEWKTINIHPIESTLSADDGNSIFLFKLSFLNMIKIFQQCM